MKDYQLYAKSDAEGIVGTYAEAATVEAAIVRCKEEFPEEEGWTNHEVVEIIVVRKSLHLTQNSQK